MIDEKALEAAAEAMRYWKSPEPNMQGFTQIYHGGKLHSIERDEDDAADKVTALNAQAAITAYLGALDGWVIAPSDPTAAMLAEGHGWTNHHADCVDSIYRAMIAARP